MKHGRSAQELAQEIMRQSEKKHDVHALTSAIEMQPETVHGERGVCLAVKGQDAFRINSLAHDQIGEHVGIPAKYYDRLLTEDPELLAQNVNRWLHGRPSIRAEETTEASSVHVDTRLIRTLDGTVRAFLSDRYKPLENVDLFASVFPVIQAQGLEVMSCEITERRLFLKVVHPNVTRELKKHGAAFGDGGHTIVRVTAPAITISNSEVGCGALSVLAGYYDNWCSNLATFSERSTRKYHVGKRHELVEGNAALLSDETRQARDKATWLEVRDTVQNAFNTEQFNKLIDRVEGTMEDNITGDPVKVVELTAKKFGMTETDSQAVLRDLINGGSLTRFGLANAITRASQDMADYERASAAERAGGTLIELPKSEWNELAKAA